MSTPRALEIRSVGSPKGFWQEGATHFRERLRPYASLRWVKVKQESYGAVWPRSVEKEGAALLRGISPEQVLIALDAGGRSYTSEAFSEALSTLWDEGRVPTFIIGGPYGLSGDVLTAARTRLSLSSMTLLHDAALLFLLEQIYRAVKILHHEPYHH